MDLAIPADHRVKFKETKKKNKCLDHAWELGKKNCDSNATYTLVLLVQSRDWRTWK